MLAEHAAQVVAHAFDLRALHARSRLEPVLRDDRTRLHAADLRLDLVGLEFRDDEAARHFERRLVHAGLIPVGVVQKRKGRRKGGDPLHGRAVYGGRLLRTLRFGPALVRIGRRKGALVGRNVVQTRKNRNVRRLFVDRLGPRERLRLGGRLGGLLFLLAVEELSDRLENEEVEKASHALAHAHPLEVHEKRKTHADQNEKDDGRKAHADVVFDREGEPIAEHAARVPRQTRFKAAQAQGLERRRSHKEHDEPEGRRKLRRAQAFGIPFAAALAPLGTKREDRAHEGREHEPPGGKTEGGEKAVRNPGAHDAAPVRRLRVGRKRKGRVRGRIGKKKDRKKNAQGRKDDPTLGPEEIDDAPHEDAQVGARRAQPAPEGLRSGAAFRRRIRLFCFCHVLRKISCRKEPL